MSHAKGPRNSAYRHGYGSHDAYVKRAMDTGQGTLRGRELEKWHERISSLIESRGQHKHSRVAAFRELLEAQHETLQFLESHYHRTREKA